ncbi:MAG TPA: PH domain-containing protein [Candidatus Fimivivens sp.]|nr:PH domain-containing protein [Candidatus Fimivivens sp.]
MSDYSRIRFPGIHDEERVLAVYHRHWFNIVEELFLSVILSVILLGGFFFLPSLYPEIVGSPNASLFFFLENSFFLFLWLTLFLIWIDVFFDIWIITNERIVNIEQKGLFVRRVSELRFRSIQDVTSQVVGFIPSVLDYGDVLVQTAGENPRFIFRNVPNPVGVKDLIMKLADRDRRIAEFGNISVPPKSPATGA